MKNLLAIFAIITLGGLAACTENPVAQDEAILNRKEIQKDEITTSPILPPQKKDVRISDEDYSFKANMK